MTKTLTQDQVDRLFSFIGYGPAAPRFVFIGQKEYTPEHTEMDNLQIRLAQFPLLRHDKNIAHQALIPALGARAASKVRIWEFASMFMAAYRAPGRSIDSGGWRTTWNNEHHALGTLEGDSLLTELYPLVRHKIDAWPAAYESEFPEYSGRNAQARADRFHQKVFPMFGTSPRVTLIQDEVIRNIAVDGVAVCYGAGAANEFWRRFECLFPAEPSYLADSGPNEWHVVRPGRVEVAIASTGVRVAKIGFPWGQFQHKPVTADDIPALVNALKDLRAPTPAEAALEIQRHELARIAAARPRDRGAECQYCGRRFATDAIDNHRVECKGLRA